MNIYLKVDPKHTKVSWLIQLEEAKKMSDLVRALGKFAYDSEGNPLGSDKFLEIAQDYTLDELSALSNQMQEQAKISEIAAVPTQSNVN